MQAIAVATLGNKSDSQKVDSMRNSQGSEENQLFYLHYFFPPSSVGEVGRTGGPGVWGVHRQAKFVWRA